MQTRQTAHNQSLPTLVDSMCQKIEKSLENIRSYIYSEKEEMREVFKRLQVYHAKNQDVFVDLAGKVESWALEKSTNYDVVQEKLHGIVSKDLTTPLKQLVDAQEAHGKALEEIPLKCNAVSAQHVDALFNNLQNDVKRCEEKLGIYLDYHQPKLDGQQRTHDAYTDKVDSVIKLLDSVSLQLAQFLEGGFGSNFSGDEAFFTSLQQKIVSTLNDDVTTKNGSITYTFCEYVWFTTTTISFILMYIAFQNSNGYVPKRLA